MCLWGLAMNDTPLNIREQSRKIIRDYYNTTFEYAMEQFKKGDISTALANAESKQKALDDPYLDKLMSIFTTQLLALREAMHKHWLADPKYRNLAVDKDHSTDYFRALGHDQAIDQVTAQIDDLIKEYQK